MQVVHDAQASRFESAVDGQVGVLEYQMHQSAREVVFTHTHVPPALRGQGIAAALVGAALAWARSEGLHVVPACSYVRSHMNRLNRQSRTRLPASGGHR